MPQNLSTGALLSYLLESIGKYWYNPTWTHDMVLLWPLYAIKIEYRWSQNMQNSVELHKGL